MKKLSFLAWSVIVLLPATSLAAGSEEPAALSITQGSAAEVKYHGGIVSPPMPKPRFVLTDTSGRPFDFWQETQGYLTLLFFGYTRCPDLCPLRMANLAGALKKISPSAAGRVRVVFVTTDPARDTRKVIRSWLDRFDERFIGLTGSPAAIDAAQWAANIPPARKSPPRGGEYAVGHASFVFAYTLDNLAHVVYPSGVSREDWTRDLPNLVRERWNAGPASS